MVGNHRIVSEGITFDDVLLIPRYSDFKRQEVDLTSKLHDKLSLKLPVISSPMDKVTEESMAIAMSMMGGLGIIHRNLSIEKQSDFVRNLKSQIPNSKTENGGTTVSTTLDSKGRLFAAAAVGAGSDLEERMEALVEVEVDLVCVDSGHGHSKYILEACKFIKEKYPNIILMAGNVATRDGAKALIDCGVDILRVGVGPGSICTTRIISGMGVPQLTAVYEVAQAVEGTKVTLVADGGIKQTGDMAKALGMGAHAVMLGSLLAGFDESPGEVVENEGIKYKEYRGMGSLGAMVKGGAERYGQNPDELKEKLITEGVEGLVKYKGEVGKYLYQVEGSLKSAFYYIGSKNLHEFHKNAQFTKITNAGMRESDYHSIKMTSAGSNYNKL